MGHQELYNENYDIFLGYLKNTNQKEVLINNIKYKLKIKKGEQFIFTDIGAGDGRVTGAVINFLKPVVNLNVNYIEPSKDLIKIYIKNNSHNFIKFINKKFEETKLPKSDFILSSHSIYYTNDFEKFITSIIRSLNKNGVALIVKNNQKSEDIALKKFLAKEKKTWKKKSKKYFDITRYLKKNNIKFQNELIESRIDITNCLKLNKEGKSLVSFFYKTPFNQLSKENIETLQTYLKNHYKEGFLKKLEDYIWIFK